jgi:FkbM family methyltransferase
MSWLIDLMDAIRDNISDVLAFGPQFLWRYAPFVTGASAARVKVPGVGGVYLRIAESDVDVVRQVFRSNEYEIGIGPATRTRMRARYCEILKSGRIPIIVDAGANIGIATLWFKQKFPAACVVAIEPEPGNLALLRRNVANVAGVLVLDKAIGATPGFVEVLDGGLAWATTTRRADQGVSIVTMAEALAMVPNGTLFIAKIDIEGFEGDLFSDNIGWLKDVYAVYIEPHDWLLPGKATSRNFQRAMGDLDFEIYISGENLLYVRAP